MRPHLKSQWNKLRTHVEVHDIVTPTAREAAREALLARQRLQLALTLLSLGLVLIGLLLPAPVPVRLGVLAVGAVVPPLVGLVVLGSRGP